MRCTVEDVFGFGPHGGVANLPFVEGAGVRGSRRLRRCLARDPWPWPCNCIAYELEFQGGPCGRAKTEKTLKIEEKTEGKITREKQACKRNLVGENIAILAWLQ